MTAIHEWLILCVFILFAIPISITDLRCYRIPDSLCLPCFCIILVIRLLAGPESLPNHGGAALLGGLFFFCVRLGTKGLGIGDIKFAALVGLFCGLPAAFLGFAIAAFTGILAALVRRRFSAGGPAKPIPFAPFLSFGAAAAYCLFVFL